MKRKEPVTDDPFPSKFDVTHWESNEKFEKHLQKHPIGPLRNGHNEVGTSLELKRKTAVSQNGKICVSDADYDTPLWLLKSIVKENFLELQNNWTNNLYLRKWTSFID